MPERKVTLTRDFILSAAGQPAVEDGLVQVAEKAQRRVEQLNAGAGIEGSTRIQRGRRPGEWARPVVSVVWESAKKEKEKDARGRYVSRQNMRRAAADLASRKGKEIV